MAGTRNYNLIRWHLSGLTRLASIANGFTVNGIKGPSLMMTSSGDSFFMW